MLWYRQKPPKISSVKWIDLLMVILKDVKTELSLSVTLKLSYFLVKHFESEPQSTNSRY